MKKGVLFVLVVLGSLLLGLAFYMAYIHLVSWLSVPLGLLALLAAVFIIAAVCWNVIVGIKDFVVSIFKDDDTRDGNGFKKHF